MRSSLILVVICLFLHGSLMTSNPAGADLQEDPAVTKLRNYLRIQSSHPSPEFGYEKAIEWLKQQAEEIGLEYHFIDFPDPDKFALWMTWNGTNPTLKSVLLNSHMDVVAAEADKWEHHPFEAYKDEQGNIYGRGAVDMKSATVAELEAIRRLKSSGFQPLRTIHLSVLPDEELGGKHGMLAFSKTGEFRSLNVGIDIDEGLPTGRDDLVDITYAEKASWKFNITARGESSHASNLPQYTAGQRLQVVIDKLLAFRKSEYDKLESGQATIDQLTSLNLVKLGGGTATNIIPSEVWATFDMRIWLKPGWNFTDVEAMILSIAKEASLGPGPDNQVNVTFILKGLTTGRTPPDDSNVWWIVVQNTCQELNVTCPPHVFNAASDGHFVRDLNISVFGICPFPSTPNTAHQHNEFINENHFLRGVERYVTLIRNVAMLPANMHP